MSRCSECDVVIEEKNSVTCIEVEKQFCSLSCLLVYVERFIDELQTKYSIPLTKEIKEEENKILLENFSQEKQASYDKGYDDGYLEGYLEAIKSAKICPVCNTKLVESLHHILPRKYGGFTSLKNIIALCDNCHDKIEEQTEKTIQRWFKKGININIETLKNYILQGFPEDLEELGG